MLLLLIFLPIIGGFIGWLCHLFRPYLAISDHNKFILKKLPRWIAIATIFLSLSLVIMFWYDAAITLAEGNSWKQEVDLQWIPLLGINFHLMLDSFSILMITSTLLIVLLALIYSQDNINNRILFYFCILLMTSFVMMTFVVTDLFLLFFCWEAVAIPFYFLISLWGRRDSSAQVRFIGVSKFLIYTQVSSLFMLISIVSLALINWNLTDTWTFDSQVLTKTPISSDVEFFLMLGFLIAFIVRMPLVPFHNWFIEAHVEASTTGSMIISGLLVSTAPYGFLRFILPMFPNASQAILPVMLGLSCITLFYAALVAFNQSDIKRLMANVHISLMGFLTAMIYVGTLLTYQGVVIQIIAISLSMVGLFVISGLLVEIYLTRNVNQFIGVKGRVSYLATFTLFFVLSVFGVPGTANFIGNCMMLLGSYSVFSFYTSLLLIGLLLLAIVLVVRINPILYGVTDQTVITKQAVGKKDIFLLVILVGAMIVIGLYPAIILDMSYPFINQTVQHINAVRVGDL